MAATTESKYLRFLPESDSAECGHSFFGIQGGDQPILIRCYSAGTVVHEIMHALGFGHEHQRADRDSFIRLHPECVTPETMAAFQTQVLQTFQSVPYGPYDYASIMHYPQWGAFSSSSTCPVITPIPTDFFDSSPGLFWGLDARPTRADALLSGIGQTCGLSRGDVLALNYFYGGPHWPARSITKGCGGLHRQDLSPVGESTLRTRETSSSPPGSPTTSTASRGG